MMRSKWVGQWNWICGKILLGIMGLMVILGGGIVEAADGRGEQAVEKIVGPGECGECHKAEVHVWRETRHAKTFKDFPRKKKTKAIAKKMGIKRVKKDKACVVCHFTAGYKKKKVKAIAGISCESCHGPAKDWLKVHGDYGGKQVTRDQETPAHKAERLATIKDAGMIRPVNLYRLAANCYQCHTVPHEDLVNVGGHQAASQGFELVAWSLGEVRHKFLRSAGKTNEEVSAERKRLLYVIGNALDLEYSLRRLAQATTAGPYATAMTTRVRTATEKLQVIQTLVPTSEINAILGIVQGLELKIQNHAALEKAAKAIAAEAQQFADLHDGSQLTALDPVLPKSKHYQGTPGQGPPVKK